MKIHTYVIKGCVYLDGNDSMGWVVSNMYTGLATSPYPIPTYKEAKEKADSLANYLSTKFNN